LACEVELALPSSGINKKDLSEEQLMLLEWVTERKEVPVQEFIEHIEALRKLISQGFVRLKISTHVWGVEFFVTISEPSQ